MMDKHSKPWIIYTLTDPRTGEVRYVGKTHQPETRQRQHVEACRRGGETAKDLWVRELLADGCEPMLTVVEHGEGPGWQDAERKWVAEFSATGGLLNLTAGGLGALGSVRSEDAKRRTAEKHRGMKRSAEARAKMAEAKRGRPLSDEHRKALSEAQKHRPAVTAETRRRMSDASRTRQDVTDETRQRMAASARSRGQRRTCNVEGCNGAHKSLGLCKRHYDAQRHARLTGT